MGAVGHSRHLKAMSQQESVIYEDLCSYSPEFSPIKFYNLFNFNDLDGKVVAEELFPDFDLRFIHVLPGVRCR